MPEPLKRIKKDGTAYERPPEIEDWLKKLETVEAAERLRPFATLSRKGVGYVPSDHFCVFHANVTVDFSGVTGHFKNIVTGDFRNNVTGF